MSNLLPTPAPQSLARQVDDRRLAGVCSGIAAYFGIDPMWVRLGFIGLALTGVSILLYPIMWFIMPKSNSPRVLNQQARFDPMTGQPLPVAPPVARTEIERRRSRVLGGLLLLAGIILAGPIIGALDGLIVPVLIIAGGLMLLRKPAANA